jgi:hypothetical protein
MAKYFSKFPKIFYNFGGNTTDTITNIVSRFRLESSLKNNTSAYYNYTIRDGETPEILAFNLYNSTEKHWIILMMNDIVDAQYDWPLQYVTLNRYIENKYSTSEYADTANTSNSGFIWSQTNSYAFYKKETIIKSGVEISTKLYEIDEEQYDALILLGPQISNPLELSDGNFITIKTFVDNKTYYDYENELNESKRIIKILKNDFVTSLELELEEIFNE